MTTVTKKRCLTFCIRFGLFCFATKASLVSAFLCTTSSSGSCYEQHATTTRPSVTALCESSSKESWQEVARKIVSLNTQLSESHLELQRNRVAWMKEKLNLVRNVADFQSNMGRSMQEVIAKDRYGDIVKEFEAELGRERAQMDQKVGTLQKEIFQLQDQIIQEQQKSKALEMQMENWKAELLVLWKESEAEKKNLRDSLDEKTQEVEDLKAKEQLQQRELEEQTREIETLQEQLLTRNPDQVELVQGADRGQQPKDLSATQVKMLRSELETRDRQRNDHVRLAKQSEMEKSEMRGLLVDQGRQIRELKAQLYHAKKGRQVQDETRNCNANNSVDAKATVPDNQDDDEDSTQGHEMVGQWE